MKDRLSRITPATTAGACINSLVVMLLLVVCILVLLPVQYAFANTSGEPSVLLVDANLGDLEAFSHQWMGENDILIELASANGATLTTSEQSQLPWWGQASSQAPQTYLLASPSGAALSAEHIIWALDEIKSSGGQAKTFIVAFGPSGYIVREYIEDLAQTKQSERADVVGVAFCGTALSGYTTMASYPELGIWDSIAGAVGLMRQDIAPNSNYLAQLDAVPFPKTVKTLVISGSQGDLGFGATDGAAIAEDFVLSPNATAGYDSLHTSAVISQQINLSGEWNRFTNDINTPGRTVDVAVAEVISSGQSYATSEDIRYKVREFYETWFAGTNPVTHVSDVVVLDLSGSMNEEITAGNIKIDVAKNAVREFLQAAEVSKNLPYAAFVDVTITGFSTELNQIATGYDDQARSAVSGMSATAGAETNIGIALTNAIERLGDAPSSADKRVLLLSDGASTEGLTNKEMLEGPVLKAAQLGIVIDTIGFGDVGESNAQFLKDVAQATGGVYYSASNTYELEVDFLRVFYTSLGADLIDEELPVGTTSFDLGEADEHTAAWSIGFIGKGITPDVQLAYGDELEDESSISYVSEGSFTAIQYVDPSEGKYSLEFDNLTEPMHVFALQQKGLTSTAFNGSLRTDYSLILLLASGLAMVASVLATIVFTNKRVRKHRVEIDM